MNSKLRNSVFANKARSHTIVVARGDRVRHWTLPSWMLGAAGTLGVLTLLGGAGAIALSLSGDRVIRLMLDREIRATTVYEERISGLRQELDRITTRQHIDREQIGRQVESLLSQQERLVGRFDKLEPLLTQAADYGLVATGDEKPTAPSAPSPGMSGNDPLLGLRTDLEEGARSGTNDVDHIRNVLLPTIRQTVGMVEEQQMASLAKISEEAADKAEQMSALLRPLGYETDAVEGTGGPYVPPPGDISFESQLGQLQQTLDAMGGLRSAAESLPLGDPEPPGTTTTSRFGVRTDPFLGREALHTGIDFAGILGTRVSATGKGRVISAGDQGGYGLAIEIDHGNGVSTRFAHLSRIDVKAGQDVVEGTPIGAVGSTGRSTGPHLHYEVRLEGRPVDPQRYISTGRKWAAL